MKRRTSPDSNLDSNVLSFPPACMPAIQLLLRFEKCLPPERSRGALQRADNTDAMLENLASQRQLG